MNFDEKITTAMVKNKKVPHRTLQMLFNYCLSLGSAYLQLTTAKILLI